MIKHLCIAFGLVTALKSASASPFPASPFNADTKVLRWDCRYGTGGALTQERTIAQDDKNMWWEGGESLVPSSERYTIIEHAPEGIIAISHRPTVSRETHAPVGAAMTVITLDPKTGHFRLLGINASHSYSDDWTGNCVARK